MISAIEAVMVYLATFSDLTDLVGTRIAPRHRYSDGWAKEASSLVVRYDGGNNLRYVEDFFGRIELDCYGNTYSDAELIYHELVTIQRAFQNSGRVQATLADANIALIQMFDLISSPTPLNDPDIDMPYLMVFGEIRVAEAALA